MVYMSGDNNLERYISSDLETELAVPGSGASVQVTALADRGPGYDRSHGNWRSTKLFHVTPGMTAMPAARSPTGANGTWGTHRPWPGSYVGRRPTTRPTTTP